MLRKILKLLNQKGQTLILYVLLTPMLFFAGGAAADLGWYYLNVAQLQNAADAAALAGAQVINEKNNSILIRKFPDNEQFSENLSEDIAAKKNDADDRAKKFLNENWNNGAITSKENLYKNESSALNLYYVVQLDYNSFKHLFNILDNLGDNKISVSAIAKLNIIPPQTPIVEDDTEELQRLKAQNVISGNWEVEAAKLSGKRWKAATERLDNYYIQNSLHTYDSDKTWINYNSKTNTYDDGANYRYAIVDVEPANSYARIKTDGWTTYTNEKDLYKLRNPDSLTFGFRQDITRVLPGGLEIQSDGSVKKVGTVTDAAFEKDWDIRRDDPYNRKTEVRYINQNGGSKYWYPSCDIRIHNVFDLKNFEVRQDKITEENPYDILWVRIESEAFIPVQWFGVSGKDNHFEYKSVRQIVINAAEDNTIMEEGKYKYRPYVMFYDGPEKIDMDSPIRNSKPVILNLNANFRGILFAPNSPVIINDNGYTFEGFVVAREYYELAKIGSPVKYNDNIYVDKFGEVAYSLSSRTKCGTFKNFNIGDFEDYGYEVEDNSQENLFIY